MSQDGRQLHQYKRHFKAVEYLRFVDLTCIRILMNIYEICCKFPTRLGSLFERAATVQTLNEINFTSKHGRVVIGNRIMHFFSIGFAFAVPFWFRLVNNSAIAWVLQTSCAIASDTLCLYFLYSRSAINIIHYAYPPFAL